MATSDIDVIVNVFSVAKRNRRIGMNSPYTDEKHPGTDQKILGWMWGRRPWSSLEELKGLQFAPTIYDATISGIREEYFQSGYGDNEDLKLLDIRDVNLNDGTIWSPRLHHGQYYIQSESWYLFSDAYQSQVFSGAQTISGLQYIDLNYELKPTIPIVTRLYRLNSDLDRHVAFLDFKKKITFSAQPTGPEFRLDLSRTPPRVWLDGDYSFEIGGDITLTASGTSVDPTEFDALELLGRSNGEKDQVFNTEYSPLDPWAPVEIWTYQDEFLPKQWTVISGYEDFSQDDFLSEVRVDYDTGKIQFGNFDFSALSGGGKPPARGNKVFMRYTRTPVIHYEPKDTTNFILGYTADVRPTSFIEDAGFVQLSTSVSEPTSIELTTTMATDVDGPFLSIGNNIGELIATVKDSFGNLLEAETVTFTIRTPVAGDFGAGRTTVTAKTNGDGEAKVLLRAPLDIDDISKIVASLTPSGSDSIISVAGLQTPSNLNDLVLYKIHLTDEVLGLPVTGLDNYYSNYFADEGIISDPDTTLATRSYEEDFRERNSLATPGTYTTPTIDLKKTLLITQKSGVMNPKTGVLDTTAFSPLYPSSVVNTTNIQNPRLELTYDSVTLDPIGTGDTLTYMVAGNIRTNIVASVTNVRTNTRFASAPLFVTIKPSDTVNGTFFCDVLNDVPSGLLTKVKNIEDLTDAEILSTAGVQGFSESYTAERQVLASPGDTQHIVRYRYQKPLNTLETDLNVQLLSGATLIAQWTTFGVTTTKTEEAQELTSAEVVSIPDYSDLRLAFSVIDHPPTGDATTLDPSRIEVFSGQLEVEGRSIALTSFIGDQIARPVKDISRNGWTSQTAPVLIQTAGGKLEAFFGSGTFDAVATLAVPPKDNSALVVSIVAAARGDIGNNLNRVTNISCPNVTQWILLQEQFFDKTDAPSDATITTYTYLAPNLKDAGQNITVTTELIPNPAPQYPGSTFVYVSEYQGLNRSDLFVDYAFTSNQSGTSFTPGPAAADPNDHGLFLGRVITYSGVADFTNPTNDFSVDDSFDMAIYKQPTTLMKEVSIGLLSSIQPASGIADFTVDGESTTEGGIAEIITLRSAFDATDDLWSKVNDADLLLANDISFIQSPVSGIATILALDTLTDPRILTPEYEDYVDWFRRTRQGDVVGITEAGEALGDTNIDGLLDVQAMYCPAEIPVGFRIRSTGITIASVIDQITYIDINDHLPEGYYDVQSNISTLGHQFKVVVI